MKGKAIRITALLAVCFLHAVFLQAQSKTLTLEEAIELSIRNSPQLKFSQAKIDEANAALREANERKLPEAKVSGSYIRLNSPNIDMKSSGTGSSGGNTSAPEKISSAAYGILNLSLPLYSGSRIRYGIESSRFLAEAAKLDAASDREQIVLNTINAFANLYKANAAMRVVREGLEGNRERVKQFTSLEKNGLLARNDLLKAELQESNTELTLLDAENNWKLANINMNIMLGLPDSTVLQPSITKWKTDESGKSIEDYLQQASQNRKEIAAIELRRKAAGAGIKIAKADYYPSLALTGGYIAADIPNFITITNAANIGIGVQYSLSSLWKNHSKVEQAKAKQKEIEANETMLSDDVRREVHQAYLDFTLNRQKISTYTKAVAQAEENYRIVKNKYNNALATTTDLLDADVAQLQARLNFVFSEADASASYSKLLYTAGVLSSNNKQ
jgi:outer membrane protein TolC